MNEETISKDAKYLLGKINIDLVDEKRLFEGKKGRYLDLVFFPKKSEPGTWLIKQSISKEERGEVDLPILGDFKEPQQRPRNEVFGESMPTTGKTVMPKNEHPKTDENYEPPF